MPFTVFANRQPYPLKSRVTAHEANQDGIAAITHGKGYIIQVRVVNRREDLVSYRHTLSIPEYLKPDELHEWPNATVRPDDTATINVPKAALPCDPMLLWERNGLS